jgi:hypothetical protein
MEQLLLVTSCDSPAGIGASLRTDTGRTDTGWTDRRDVGNSILDVGNQILTLKRLYLVALDTSTYPY